MTRPRMTLCIGVSGLLILGLHMIDSSLGAPVITPGALRKSSNQSNVVHEKIPSNDIQKVDGNTVEDMQVVQNGLISDEQMVRDPENYGMGGSCGYGWDNEYCPPSRPDVQCPPCPPKKCCGCSPYAPQPAINICMPDRFYQSGGHAVQTTKEVSLGECLQACAGASQTVTHISWGGHSGATANQCKCFKERPITEPDVIPGVGAFTWPLAIQGLTYGVDTGCFHHAWANSAATCREICQLKAMQQGRDGSYYNWDVPIDERPSYPRRRLDLSSRQEDNRGCSKRQLHGQFGFNDYSNYQGGVPSALMDCDGPHPPSPPVDSDECKNCRCFYLAPTNSLQLASDAGARGGPTLNCLDNTCHQTVPDSESLQLIGYFTASDWKILETPATSNAECEALCIGECYAGYYSFAGPTAAVPNMCSCYVMQPSNDTFVANDSSLSEPIDKTGLIYNIPAPECFAKFQSSFTNCSKDCLAVAVQQGARSVFWSFDPSATPIANLCTCSFTAPTLPPLIGQIGSGSGTATVVPVTGIQPTTDSRERVR